MDLRATLEILYPNKHEQKKYGFGVESFISAATDSKTISVIFELAIIILVEV